MKSTMACAAFLLCGPVLAQDTPPVPKMFQGMQGEKGQWQMEMLEGPAAMKGSRIPAMTLCTDNLMRGPEERRKKRAESDCKHRLLKDTADEAVMETVCKERKTTVTMKREGPKSMLMSIDSTGPRGPQTMKMRYTHLGPCAEGQAGVTVDKNSEQCRKLMARAEKMDPAKSCAKKADPAACEQRMRETAEKLTAMCR
jgi:hypothetical protein